MAEPMMGASARSSNYSTSYQHHSSSNPYQYHTQTTQPHDQYRGPSSAGNHVALPSINLPSLRELDNPLQQSSHAQTLSQVSASLPPPSYYSQHVQQPLQQSMGYSTVPGPGASSAHMRYPLPAPTDARMMSGGRHKKEIKRRTKTGCLTCRKRRIKCDEQHPKCRNCLKSKRECAGYDPIFKQQQGPQTLQPALPNTSQSSLPTPPTSGSTHGITPGPPSYPTPSLLHQSPVQSTHHHATPETTHGAEYRYSTGAPLHTPEEYSRPSLYHTSSNPESYISSSTTVSMENLFYVSGFPAPQTPTRTDPLHPNAYNEIRKVYLDTFAEGCNALLETTWFLQAGADALMDDKELCYLMDDLLRRYATIGQSTDYTAELTCRALETKAVWKLLSLVRRPSPYGVPAANDPSTIELFEARARLDVLEHLLKNSTATNNPVSTLHYPDAASHSHDKRQEVQFWSLVGDFISLPPTNPATTTTTQNPDQTPDTLLHSVRSALRNLENRDVIYSIICIRHLVKRHAGFPDHLQANPRAGEADDVNKLIIARDFLRKQAGWHGTTHPIQRVCDMATRSWSVFPR